MNTRSFERLAFRVGVPALMLLLLAIAFAERSGREPVAASPAESAPSYANESAQANEQVASLEQHAASHPDSWIALERAALAELECARLTGDYRGYATADSLMARAFELAPQGAGPHLLQARLHFSLHRLDRVEPHLEALERAVLVDDRTRAAIAALRADLAFQRGRYDEAERGYREVLAMRPSMGGRAALANLLGKTGRWDEAEALYEEALADLPGATGHAQAWLHLQLGIMRLDVGELDRALAHFEDADCALPGWWLVEEHMAEALAKAGKRTEAKARYRDLIERTANPEFMDALAELLDEAGQTDEARMWIARAGEGHEQRVALLPEAALGHALDHYLSFGDPEVALSMARRNHALRPNGESAIALAKAYLKAGRPDEARAVIARVTTTSWQSAALRQVTDELGGRNVHARTTQRAASDERAS